MLQFEIDLNEDELYDILDGQILQHEAPDPSALARILSNGAVGAGAVPAPTDNQVNNREGELYDLLNGQILPGDASDQGVSVKQLAIDGPSENMCKFLRKNYGVEELVRQSNNFAVAPEFFQQDSDEIRDTGRSTPALVQGAVGRHSAMKPKSSIGMVIHGSEQNMSAYGAAGKW